MHPLETPCRPSVTTQLGRRLGPWLPLAFFAVLVILRIAQTQPFPQVDLLRNVVAYAWGYDYQALYAFAPGMPSFNPYIGFDLVFGAISQATSPAVAVLLSQLLATLALGAVVLAPLRKLPDFAFRATLVIALLLATLITNRLVNARPEVLITVWCLSAATLSPWRWLALGAVLAPAYWLAPMYACGAFLLRVSWPRRVLYSLMAFASTAGFWLAYAGPEWVAHLRKLPGMAALRPEPIEEAEPLVKLLGYLGTWPVLCVVAVAGALVLSRAVRACRGATMVERATRLWHSTAPAWWVVAGTFLVIGSMRHILIIAPALLLWVTTQRWPRASLNHYCGLFVLAVAMAMLTSFQFGDSRDDRPSFVLPAGSVVLSAYGRALFMLPYYNPGTIRMLPNIEPAWDAPHEKSLAVATKAGTLTCEQVATRPITHVVTHNQVLHGACFTLAEQRAAWKLWAVRSP